MPGGPKYFKGVVEAFLYDFHDRHFQAFTTSGKCLGPPGTLGLF